MDFQQYRVWAEHHGACANYQSPMEQLETHWTEARAEQEQIMGGIAL